MRISGGSAKGRTVILKKAFVRKSGHDELRPTSGKVREAIFNILGPQVPGCRFLDLFAGTGAVGFEALSRGAREVDFVDISGSRVRLIDDLAERFGFREHACSVKENAEAYLRNNRTPYDIIFVDPPYASDELTRILSLLDADTVLAPGGTLIIEHAKKSSLPGKLEQAELKKCYKYGDTMLSLYRKESS
ncbi:MAG TPA: 16S rRNA (guanine(966)-N(2))-methyltransferase RsmD [Dissulfurispiraceae bacterium]|nr:16S rRNA (guanine(966)-N(2))-methyltransferase RsmD [Dissulfurispiraceae bacterium]